MNKWGYVPTLQVLAGSLLGGGEKVEFVEATVRNLGDVSIQHGFACLDGSEELVEPSLRRLRSNQSLNGAAQQIAHEFAEDLVRLCPFVEGLAVSGSVAGGGFDQTDDIDFDLFVESGTKYTSYLIATVLGIKYSWRNRHRKPHGVHRTPLLPKVICLNVVWTDHDTRPFARQDADLAFELMRCQPIYGSTHFQRVCKANSWILSFFPQLDERIFADRVLARESVMKSILASIKSRRHFMRGLERLSRSVVWVLYNYVQWTRVGDPEAVARQEFLRRVKWPYEVFQD